MLQELQNHYDDPRRVLPPLPRDKQEVEPAFDLLRLMPLVGRTLQDTLNLPPAVAHGADDAVVLGTALEKFIGGGLYSCRQP